MSLSAGVSKFISLVNKDKKPGIITTVDELLENQYGLPLPHYAQWYLFGSTGLRMGVFHSISGMPASCKSPLLFDLIGHVCEDEERGGLGGLGVLYELEDKISPTLLKSIMDSHGNPEAFMFERDMTLDSAFEHLHKRLVPLYNEACPDRSAPLIIGLDSIGGAASEDIVEKLAKEGVVGKGYHEKPHQMKNFCEASSKVLADIPFVIMCINQEKEQASSTPYGPPQKKITGGASQVFKAGHMISASYKTLASGDGKVVTLRTTKTSFSDARKIEVEFRWNKFGDYDHRFNWALASAKVIADPDKGVGDIRDICNVSVSAQNLVTCPQLGLRSVPPEEFEAALMANEEVLDALCRYQKIDRIKGVKAYTDFVALKNGKAPKKAAVEPPEAAPKSSKVKVTKKSAKKEAPAKDAKSFFDIEDDMEASNERASEPSETPEGN